MLIVVTNRQLCREDFLKRLEKIAQGRPDTIILREKDLPVHEYLKLFRKCEEICTFYGVPIAANPYLEAAEVSRHRNIQLSYPRFIELQNALENVKEVGVSVHHVQEAAKLNGSCATRLIAGHIFLTVCKKGVPPRGLEFLREVCEVSELPVYAIGGINRERAREALDCGCKGVCVMSELMTCVNPAQKVREYQALM